MGFLVQKAVLMFIRACLRYSFYFLIVSCSTTQPNTLPYYNTPDFTPYFLSKNEAKKKITHQIPDFLFLDQNSRDFSSESLDNKIHVASFIFTTCSDICPNMTSNMKFVEKAFFNDSLVNILSFSVTPWIDTPKRLLDYAGFYNIKSNNWYFLTGNKSKIYSLARKSYFAEEEFGYTKDSAQFLHTEHFILVDQNKKIRGIYNGTLELEAKQLIEDIVLLKNSLRNL